MNEQQIFISEQLELQVDSLNELKYKKVFANEEISKIVQKRTDYLYLLASALPKEDLLHPYLSHMLFELNLLQLIKTRLKLNKKKNNDFNIHLQFPYNQYKIGIAKFSTQIYLMKSYIDFCMQYQLKPNSAFDQVLSKHSNQEQLWLLFSKFEFEYNQAIDSGIEILKNGIRAIPHTSQYLHLELLKLYLIKSEYAEFKMLFNSLLQNLNNVEYGYFFEIIKLLMFYYREELTKNDEKQDEMSDDDEEPTSNEKQEFFTEIIQFILEKVLLKNYRNDEKCLYEIFKFKLTYFNNNTDYEELISNMENICDRICHTSKMYHYYILLLIDIFNITKKVEYINRIHTVFGKMNNFNLLNFRTILIYSNVLLSIEDNTQQVVKVLKQLHLINSNQSNDFIKCLLLLLDLTKYSRESIDYSVKLVNEKSTDNEFKIQFYEQLFANISKSTSQEQLQQLYLDGIKNTGNSHEIKKLYFKFIIDHVATDYQKLDKYVKLILSLPPNTHQVYQMMITYISKHLTSLESSSCANYHSLLGYLYEQQMIENRHDWKVYIQYMQYLKKQNRLKNISSVYQKAINALSGKSEELAAFIQHYDKYVK